MNETHTPLDNLMSDQLLTYARQRHPLTWRSVFEIAGMLGAVGLWVGWGYVVYWMMFG